MPDVSTALLSASTKPLFKMILKLRPGKLKKLAADAELQVTGLLFEGTAFIDDEAEFAHILLGRAEVDAARLETRASSWKKNGIRYIKITYRYYASATALLRQTKVLAIPWPTTSQGILPSSYSAFHFVRMLRNRL
ncbi:hypothetical protein BV20DRAFT_969309 [Pilatotrama ljubarskyi]|nr:hypothetical protein BV20DRAFT_969309 [Pilatotrama ljubarskyi]